LVLRLKHDSWVEVYDMAGKRLFFNLAKAGQTLALSGTPPFRVILGYARDAEVEYNDAPFDPSPFINKDIARFTVGG
jgi:cytoskeleton protein RodZ